MKTLFLTLKGTYFEQIAAGIKLEEYRQIKPFFTKRLIGKDYDAVLFQNGYDPESPRMLVEYLGYEIKTVYYAISNKFEQVYAIKLGNILELVNYERPAYTAAKNHSTCK